MLAYQILHMVDTTFSGSFGWRKGAIWAVEEPESFLHARLQSELARSFAEYAASDTLQIIVTTHSGAFLGASENGVVVQMDESGRSLFAFASRREVVRAAYSAGATPYAHPLHTGPPKPMLLVEGKRDRDLILHSFSESDLANPFDVLCLGDFDERMSGGDQIPAWLRYHRDALEARPETSPIIVLLDWEAKEEIARNISKALSGHPTSKCVRWPSDLTNPDLSENWAGIEKLLSTEFVEHCQNEFGLPLLKSAQPDRVVWKYSIDKRKLITFKPLLHDELSKRVDRSPLRC